MARETWNLAGKVILVTGGARGIGAAGAAELARRGAIPVLADVDDVALKAAAQQIGSSATTVHLDVTDLAECERAVASVLEQHGHLDGVWANAGIGVGGPTELVDPQGWARVIEVNLIGAFNTVRAALPAVIEARGHVAITASAASFAHAPGLSAYAASKAGVEAFADSLRAEVAHQGVSVTTLHPSWIDTDMVRDGDSESAAFRRLRKSMRGPMAKTHPVASIVGPIADAFAARQPRLFLPGFMKVVYRLRNSVNTLAMQRDQLKAVPEMRRLFVEQAEREGTRHASLGRRWS